LASLYEQQGDISKAWQEYKSLVDTLSSEKPEEAIVILNKFKEEEPIENRKKLAFLYRQADKVDQSVHELVDLGDIYSGEGRKEEALSTFKEAQDLAPDNTEIISRIEMLEQGAPGAAAQPEEM
ncbi:MAG: hypothetical protein GWN61_21910, partial [candidate division Zixibacteria bacterium]|nr:hypothetical protein [candidate division Zixibacteria bacterium]NIR67100.1 hypothetical protein [candidate division Zixibacteria bacterium]NIS48522.1 hypothetical protein [candidate division Zixibacteria bacterium]NIU16610.1 hypothetical protein [candidate division Zixibacteria bacterium]NIV08759.1 hypothetical protein [candidate division Zixibacteria bacterium]